MPDASPLGQVPQSHLSFSRWLFNEADPANTPEAQQYWADRLLGIQHHSGSSSDSSILFANAQIDSAAATAGGGPVVLDNGRLNGRKIFCTGSIYAEVIMVTARRPGEDRQTLASHLVGELVAQRFAAEAVVEKAGRTLDELWASGGTDTSAEASLQVAAAKVTTGALTVDLASRIHELTGTRGTAGGSNLDRHWRELRTHTLHERRRDKLATLGCATLTGENPPAGPRF